MALIHALAKKDRDPLILAPSGQCSWCGPDLCNGKRAGSWRAAGTMHCWRKKGCGARLGNAQQELEQYTKKVGMQYETKRSAGHAAAGGLVRPLYGDDAAGHLYGPGGAFVCKHDHRIWRVWRFEVLGPGRGPGLAVLFGAVLVLRRCAACCAMQSKPATTFIAFKLLALIRDKVFERCAAPLPGQTGRTG